ncbi:MAG: ornithine carbamoyltransferase [Chloroflexia bacterium]|jgi:ornithine carbamoyltransferase|nr:ornithine carbamoyltransferase [Chloroflexia bacterium]
MAVSMKGRSFVSVADFSTEEIWNVWQLAAQLKSKVKAGEPLRLLEGKQLAMIFQKPSLRTQVSFETGMSQLGGHAIFLGPEHIQLGKRESVPDVARVLGRMVDGIMARVFAHSDVEELAEYAGVPVINGLSDAEHPCQALGDLFTIYEKKRRVEGVNLTYIGDGNNVAASLLLAAARVGMNITLISPDGYEVPAHYVQRAKADAALSGARLQFSSDPDDVVGSDVVYTDVWASMGQEAETEQRARIFRPYQVNEALLRQSGGHPLVMHCLPAHRGHEITDAAMDGPNSVVFEQAENRLHVQKAIMALLIR